MVSGDPPHYECGERAVFLTPALLQKKKSNFPYKMVCFVAFSADVKRIFEFQTIKNHYCRQIPAGRQTASLDSMHGSGKLRV